MGSTVAHDQIVHDLEKKTPRNRLPLIFGIILVLSSLAIIIMTIYSADRLDKVEAERDRLKKENAELHVANRRLTQIVNQAGPPFVPGTGFVCPLDAPGLCHIYASPGDKQISTWLQDAQSATWVYDGGACLGGSGRFTQGMGADANCYGYWRRVAPSN